MKKALLVTTVSGFIPQFEMNNVRILQSMGYEVHYASNYNMPAYGCDNKRLDDTGIIRHQIDFVKSPFKLKENLSAYRQLKFLMKTIKFELVHCHTPMGGVLGRLAANASKTSLILYTAHGFHFFKGAPIKNWLFFYPIERYLAKYTDVLITINKEDYSTARKFKLKKDGQVKYIPGVGIDYNKIDSVRINIEKKRKELGISKDAIIIVSIGELNKNKNHEDIIRSLASINDPNIFYLICGKGKLKKYLKKLSFKLNIEKNIIFLGYREDIIEILKISDICAMPSLREGLPVSLMEAMTVGLPVICSKIRGNTDLIVEGNGGYLIMPKDIKQFKEKIAILSKNKELRDEMGNFNKKQIVNFGVDKIYIIMKNLYGNLPYNVRGMEE